LLLRIYDSVDAVLDDHALPVLFEVLEYLIAFFIPDLSAAVRLHDLVFLSIFDVPFADVSDL
jgi:hypothetical protein